MSHPSFIVSFCFSVLFLYKTGSLREKEKAFTFTIMHTSVVLFFLLHFIIHWERQSLALWNSTWDGKSWRTVRGKTLLELSWNIYLTLVILMLLCILCSYSYKFVNKLQVNREMALIFLLLLNVTLLLVKEVISKLVLVPCRDFSR